MQRAWPNHAAHPYPHHHKSKHRACYLSSESSHANNRNNFYILPKADQTIITAIQTKRNALGVMVIAQEQYSSQQPARPITFHEAICSQKEPSIYNHGFLNS